MSRTLLCCDCIEIASLLSPSLSLPSPLLSLALRTFLCLCLSPSLPPPPPPPPPPPTKPRDNPKDTNSNLPPSQTQLRTSFKMVFYKEGDVIEYRPFGGDVKVGKIDKIETKTGGHVSPFPFF
ncbi:hypothetical protein IE53DRAFT_39715 [Violaceomyces palustris]|uniref:Uncharacterized protein n=1 Tax=Violaceomyces palustris TaxID=1673888 RepID=A0ACD0NKL1_9BASI|nr:hypothetical protein IE53DRAFT_39715 [Violaceomyces palustris]